MYGVPAGFKKLHKSARGQGQQSLSGDDALQNSITRKPPASGTDHRTDVDNTRPDDTKPRSSRPLSIDLNSVASESDNESEILDYHMEEVDDQPRSVYTPSKKEMRVNHIRLEFLATEQRYVSRLEDIVTIREITSRMLGQATAKEMFLNIDVIYELHQNFLPQLQERILNWNENSQLGDLMQKMMSFMKIYTAYVKDVQNGIRLIHSWMKKNKAFNKLIKDYTNKNNQLKIDARMIDPVQRVPRYELLLKDYLKCLPEHSEETINIQDAVDKVSDAARYFETMMERDIKVTELLKLQQSLDGPVNIFSFTRELIKESTACILNKTTNKFESCQIYLLTDLLMITRYSHTMLSVRNKVKHLMDLNKCGVGPGCSNNLCLSIYTRKAEIEIQFDSKEEMVDWELSLRYRFAELTKTKLTRRGTWERPQYTATLFNSPPQYVLPHTTHVCMLCGLDFDTPKRKKNCDACGIVVCSRCSPHRIKLPYDEQNEHRVCHECYAACNKLKK